MGTCCTPSAYDEFFGEKQARRDARRYRRKGLDRAARWIVEVVQEQGVAGATVLEPGGGVGGIQLELLKAGAARSVIVELSRGYDDAAAELAGEQGLADRIERRVGDFAQDGVGDADVVVLHRVVCCYPSYEDLLGTAARHARRAVVFTYPPRNPLSRTCVGLVNLWMRARGKDFRAFAHRPEAMMAVATGHGFEPFAARSGLWRGAAFTRR